ncbi:helix-turn-helix transcriptional regulator [uncultured Selenomonas sp.]|uniref:helix-turn-helix transcriptional regulator n=1 Tax=uncultured Selenomonas sp. TaxID=159275 RepID=UPI0025EF6D1D|nr:helix-turn-helix domain-containing protein [uncultured Selenomonas sp.]
MTEKETMAMEFHERLLMLRRKRGITQQEAADALGVSRPTYGGYESGKRRPQKNTMYQKIADFFGVSVDEFFEGDAAKPEKQPPAQDGNAIVAQHLAGELAGMFAGGQLSEADKDAVMRSLERAYWLAHPGEKPPEK